MLIIYSFSFYVKYFTKDEQEVTAYRVQTIPKSQGVSEFYFQCHLFAQISMIRLEFHDYKDEIIGSADIEVYILF